jgi:hypothetical protein
MRLDQLKPPGAISAAQSWPLAVYLFSHATSSVCSGNKSRANGARADGAGYGATTGA